MPIINSTQAGVQPTVQLTAPYIPPAHVLEAASIEDMVSFSEIPLEWTYEIGKKPLDGKRELAVTNWCVDTELSVVISFPTFMTPDTPFPFVLPPLTTYTIGFVLNEDEPKGRAKTGQKLFYEAFGIGVRPLNVTGPVYVKPKS